MKDKLTILIADDHPMIRDSLRHAIEAILNGKLPVKRRMVRWQSN